MNDAFDTPDAPLAATGPLALLVMAGGSSSRLFPYNKVVADLTGCGRTMIQQAVDRGIAEGLEPPLVPADRFWIVTGDALAPDIGAQLPELPATNILIEPERRNTLPAILWAMAHVSAKHPDATLAVLTADHVIGDQDGFRATLRNAVAAAQRERVIVTIGIPPSDDAREWTGFGAVRVAQRDRASTDASGIRGVERFEEKPSIERARALMREGGTFWNSGMFVLRCTTLVDALRRYQPEIAAAYEELRTAVESGDADAAAAAFASLPKDCVDVTEPTRRVDNTIDYAVMVPLTHDERAEIGARLVPARFSWVDVGSWDALRKVVAADVRDNVIVGDAAIPGSRRTIAVAAEGQRVEASALERTIVVAAESCSIVVAESRAQDVKRLFAEAASSTDPTIAIDAPDCEIVCVEGRVAILGVEGLSVERRDGRTTVRPIRLARLAKLRERLLAGETVLESDYAASNGLDPDRSRDEILARAARSCHESRHVPHAPEQHAAIASHVVREHRLPHGGPQPKRGTRGADESREDPMEGSTHLVQAREQMRRIGQIRAAMLGKVEQARVLVGEGREDRKARRIATRRRFADRLQHRLVHEMEQVVDRDVFVDLDLVLAWRPGSRTALETSLADTLDPLGGERRQALDVRSRQEVSGPPVPDRPIVDER